MTTVPLEFKPRNTATDTIIATSSKTLLYAHHGFGKTTQARYYKRRFGKGYIISGEAGLKSIASEGIDFDIFNSYHEDEGREDQSNRLFALRTIAKMIGSKAFRDAGYKWIMLDSLSEASDLCFRHYDEVESKKTKKNNWDLYQEYGDNFTAFVRWLRDLPYHVIVTALVKEEKDDNGSVHYWPMLQGQKVARKLPGMFDNVFAGQRMTVYDPSDLTRSNPTIVRRIVTDEINGWHGKARDEHNRLAPVEHEADVTELLTRIELSPAAYDAYIKATKK